MGITPVLAQKEWIPGAKVYSTLAEYEKLTGKKIEKFHEAPMLRVKVAAGELPPVEKRLPEEPLVIEPIEEIGQYGGRITGTALGPTTWNDTAQPRLEFSLTVNNKVTEVLPNIAKGYDFSEDKKTLTLYLRKGMKWSDGHPFTADDYLFWYEDVLLNDELTPVKPRAWSPGGELMKMEKVDDYTIRLHFAQPYPVILNYIAYFGSRQESFFHPKHYLKRWHIKYNPKANELAKEEGYDYWWQAFNFHKITGPQQQDTNLPMVRPFILKKRTPTQKIFERNPYYWKIDTEGNQLPYLDELVCDIVESAEITTLKAIAGEISYAGMDIALKDYPLFKKNEEKGGYRTLLYKYLRGSVCAFAFNQTHKDPVLRKIFQDVRFRQAMSLAINRDEINNILYFGKAIPCQATVHPTCSYYKEEWSKAYAQYDPERANKLLDEIGLKWDKKHQYRLRPDGKSLAVTIEFWPGEGPKTKICELVKGYWEKVGVKVSLKPEERSFNAMRRNANEVDVNVWHVDRTSELRAYIPWTSKFFNFKSELGQGVLWQDWYDTGGKAGEEPPEKIKRMYKLLDEWTTTTSEEEYRRLAQELFDFYAENLFIIGTVGMAPKVIVVKNNLRNVPEKAYFDADNTFWNTLGIAQWFLKK